MQTKVTLLQDNCTIKKQKTDYRTFSSQEKYYPPQIRFFYRAFDSHTVHCKSVSLLRTNKSSQTSAFARNLDLPPQKVHAYLTVKVVSVDL